MGALDDMVKAKQNAEAKAAKARRRAERLELAARMHVALVQGFAAYGQSGMLDPVAGCNVAKVAVAHADALLAAVDGEDGE